MEELSQHWLENQIEAFYNCLHRRGCFSARSILTVAILESTTSVASFSPLTMYDDRIDARSILTVAILENTTHVPHLRISK